MIFLSLNLIIILIFKIFIIFYNLCTSKYYNNNFIRIIIFLKFFAVYVFGDISVLFKMIVKIRDLDIVLVVVSKRVLWLTNFNEKFIKNINTFYILIR